MASAEPVQPGGRPADPVRAAVARCRRLFVTAFVFSATMSILALTTSFYMLQVYDRVLASRSNDTLLLLTAIAVVAIAVFSILDSLRARLLARIGLQVGEFLSTSVLRAMVATSSWNSNAALRSGLRDVDTIRSFIASPGFGALIDAPFIVFYLIVLYLLSPFFVLIVLLGGALLVGVAVANQRLTSPGLNRSIQLSMRAHEFVEDGLRNADVLEGMGMSNAFVERWRHRWIESLAMQTAASDRDSQLSSLSRSIRLLIQILLLGVGALLILDFQSTGGIMIGASIVGARALAPIEAIVSTWKSVIAVRAAVHRLTTLLKNAPNREEGMPLPPPTGRVQVAALHFVVPGTRKTILANVAFDLAPGELLGVIGPSGSGKSTLLQLMAGAWPGSSGGVRLDGADIYAWPRTELSQHIGYLPQDLELFGGTVRENIARLSHGEPENVVRAAQRAGAHEMILALPNGYDTDIGDHGHKLSGGQSQRIGIARAVYGEPRYVLLDEPNSNLDNDGEAALIAMLAALRADRVTVVIVAHRPSILQNADKLLVLRANGSVEAFGPRAEIMQAFTRRPAPKAPANVVPMSPGISGDATPGRSGMPT